MSGISPQGVTLSGGQYINRTRINIIINNTKQDIKAETITDIANIIGFGSSINLVFDCDHIWSIKKNPHRNNELLYGIRFIVHEINYIPAKPLGINFLSPDFISESDSQDETTKTCQ